MHEMFSQRSVGVRSETTISVFICMQERQQKAFCVVNFGAALYKSRSRDIYIYIHTLITTLERKHQETVI